MNKRLQQFKGIIIGLLGLSLVIIVHEFGHFTACKLFGIRTPIFSIGFDPRIAAIKIGQTEFQLGALPLGGYVSIDPHDLAAAAYWKKMVIIFAGIFNNIIFAFLLFFLMLLRATKKPIPVIQAIEQGSVADNNGLRVGDRIVALDHEPLAHDALATLQKTAGQSKRILITVERDHHHRDVLLKLSQEDIIATSGAEFLGATFKTVTVARPPLKNIVMHSSSYLGKLFKRMGAVMESIFKSTGNTGGIIGPIGIITGLGKSAEYGLNAFLFFIAVLNINLAFFNILPIPFFDGGQAVKYTMQAAFAHRLSQSTISFLYLTFVTLFLLLVVVSMRSARKANAHE